MKSRRSALRWSTCDAREKRRDDGEGDFRRKTDERLQEMKTGSNQDVEEH